MSIASVHEGERKPGMANAYLGMLLFLVSEAFLFSALFVTYFYLRTYTPVWPPQGVHLEITLVSFNTLVLLVSSGTMQWAISAWRRGNQRVALAALLTTMLLGSTFLAIKGWEWYHEPFRPWDHAYGSIFYTLTGFHALHVLGGIFILGALLIRTSRLRSLGHPLAVEMAGVYWHFVDMVWLFVFGSVFLLR
ncbi:MAG: cytochrome c oxidase subunit 3 [Chloroflexota bacterium]|nr:cytochrome c oxidase subunit 3 [Chloroflexota bacterium]